MDPDEMRAVVERYIDAYNRMDVAGMLAQVHPEVVFRNVAAGVVDVCTQGATELEALARQSLALFSERRQDILWFQADAARAAAGIAFRAVAARDLPGGVKAGQELTLSGRTEFTFRDGLIVEITDIS